MTYRHSKAEQETSITWNAETRMANVWTVDPVVIRRLDKLVSAYPETYKLIRVDTLRDSKKYEFPAQYIRFGKPQSEEQQKAKSERAKDLALKYGFKSGQNARVRGGEPGYTYETSDEN